MAGGPAGLSLPAALRPYAALLFDGFGGVNGRDPAAVMRLTPKQVAMWYAGPMAEMRKRTEAADDRPQVKPAGKVGGPMKFATPDDMRAAFGGFAEYRDRPPEWWAAKWAEWQDRG